MTNYDNACVYKLCCKDSSIKDIYVGSTCAFKQRKCQHKSTCNNENSMGYNCYVYQFIRSTGGFDNWDMIQVEKCSVKDRKELEMRERFFLESLGASLNKVIPTRSKSERYIDCKEQVLEHMRIYNDENKNWINERQRVYDNKNKDLIEKKRSIKIDCECGVRIRKGSLASHKKTKIHQVYESTKQIVTYKGEKIECECGSTIARSSLPYHKKSAKHLNNIY